MGSVFSNKNLVNSRIVCNFADVGDSYSLADKNF